MGLVVDHELELTEIRIRELHQVVDIFVILEASVTSGLNINILKFDLSVETISISSSFLNKVFR
jgi:hypothetical protein